MRKGIATAALLTGLLAGLPTHADEPKFTNLMGGVPTSDQIVEGLITPLGIRIEPVAPVRDSNQAQPVLASTPEAAPAEPPATVALEVRFAFDSATLTPKAREVLTQLAMALKAPALADSSFLVEGHTDALGAGGYNQDLSERRAAAVRDFLTREHGVPADTLFVAGRGETELLDPANPASGVNRRVEVGNLGTQQNAQLDRR